MTIGEATRQYQCALEYRRTSREYDYRYDILAEAEVEEAVVQAEVLMYETWVNQVSPKTFSAWMEADRAAWPELWKTLE